EWVRHLSLPLSVPETPVKTQQTASRERDHGAPPCWRRDSVAATPKTCRFADNASAPLASFRKPVNAHIKLTPFRSSRIDPPVLRRWRRGGEVWHGCLS